MVELILDISERLPPDSTVRMNVIVTPLYLLLYSTVHQRSGTSDQEFPPNLFLSSSSESGRMVSPSRNFAGPQLA